MRIAALACVAGWLALAACDGRTPATSPTTAPAAYAPAVQGASSSASVAEADQAVLPSGQADRLPPPDVPPVLRGGVSYAQAEDGRAAGAAQSRGVLVASDAASGKRLWALVVYPQLVDAKQETDAQWVFFERMAFDPDGRLRIVNEAGKAFLVDVERRTVTPASRGSSGSRKLTPHAGVVQW